MKNGMLKSFADSRRVKYGTVNIIFIAIVVAIVVMLNSVVSILAEAFNWRLDMTEEQLFTISDNLIDQIEKAGKDTEVDIIFCCPKDVAEQDYAGVDNGQALAYVHSTAKQVADRLDNVKISYHDPVKEYDFFNKNFTKDDNQLSPSESTVIFARKGEDGTYGTHYRIRHVQSFYTFAEMSDGSSSIYGYSGEMVFASTILSLTNDKVPTVYFTMNHSETIPSLKGEAPYVPYLVTIFQNSGFDIKGLDLSENQFACTKNGCGATYGASEIDFNQRNFVCERCSSTYKVSDIENSYTKREVPDDANAIIINQPKYDFLDYETEKIGKYMIEDKGSVMCFTNYDKDLPVLYDFINSMSGVTIKTGSIVTDKSSYTLGDFSDFRGGVSDNNAATVYLNSLKDYGSARPIFKDSAILEIEEKYMQKEGFNDTEALKYTLPLLVTGSNATFNGERGSFPVMTVTSLQTTDSNVYSPVYSYLVVCPSSGFVNDEYLSSTAYPNDDILYSLIHSTTTVQTPVGLDYKTFESYDLDISASEARTVMFSLILILPVILVIVGTAVMVRRKRR